jgi:hypothetical protein
MGIDTQQSIEKIHQLPGEIRSFDNGKIELTTFKYGTTIGRSIFNLGWSWYPQACQFLKLMHHIHSSFEKSIIERTMQYIKDRTETFDDYFPCRKKKCKLKHIRNWFNHFISQHNKEIIR